MRVCDLHKLKTVIRFALRFIKDGERYESASCSFILLFSADGTGLKWSWWRSLLRLASSQSCQGNRPPDVAGDLGARRRHAEWRCPVNNHWLSHFKPCRWSGSEAGVKPTLLAVRINVLNNNTIAECHHFLRPSCFEAVIFGNLDYSVTLSMALIHREMWKESICFFMKWAHF